MKYLQGRDVPCPACGYNLRDLGGARCPECGRDLKPSVGTVEPIMRNWLILLCGSVAPAAMGLFFLVVIAQQGWPRGEPAGFQFAMLYYVANVAIAPVVLSSRRKFLRLGGGVQRTLAVVSVLTFFLAMVLFFAAMR